MGVREAPAWESEEEEGQGVRHTRSPGPAWGWLGMGGWAEEGCLDLIWINVGFKMVHSWRSGS